jgi:hypothetical protein
MSVIDVIIEVASDLIGGRVSWRFYAGLAFAVAFAITLYWLISAAPCSSVFAVAVFAVMLMGRLSGKAAGCEFDEDRNGTWCIKKKFEGLILSLVDLGFHDPPTDSSNQALQHGALRPFVIPSGVEESLDISDRLIVGNSKRCLDFARHDKLTRAQETQSKPLIEGAAVVFAAAGKACDCATHAADSRKLLTTIRTAIDESHCVSSRKKRQIVTTLLVNDSQVYTGLLPLGTVR